LRFSLILYSSSSQLINISSYIVANTVKRTRIRLTGYEMLEKQVNKSGNSGRVYVPIDWIGKKVKVVLVEQ